MGIIQVQFKPETVAMATRYDKKPSWIELGNVPFRYVEIMIIRKMYLTDKRSEYAGVFVKPINVFYSA